MIRAANRDKLAALVKNDQELIRFFENLGKNSGETIDGNYGDISVNGGVWEINPGAVGLNEVSHSILDRSNQTGTQTADTISDLSEAIDDRTSNLLQDGNGITLSYNDTLGTLTISAEAPITYQVDVSVSPVARGYAEVVMIDSAISTSSKITASLVGQLDAENDAESIFDDGMEVFAIPEIGQIRFVLMGSGPFSGPYRINYGVSA